jgi:hypothetical protein
MKKIKYLFRLPVSALLCAGFLVNVSSVMAESEPGPGESAAKSKSEEYQAKGVRAGAFSIYSLIEVEGEYDDNIYKMPDDAPDIVNGVDDYMVHVKPSINLQSNWSRHQLNAGASADLTYYNDHSNEDYNDWKMHADGRIDVRKDSYATGKAGYSYLHEDRNSVDDRFGKEPTIYDFTYFGLGYNHTFNRLSLVALYDYEMLTYDNAESIFGGVIDNSDRDRDRNTGSLRVGYEVRPQFDLYIEGSGNTVNYDQTLDRNGRERSSQGYRLVGGLSIDITSVLVGDIYAGYLNQDYDDPFFEDIDDAAYGFGLSWYVTDLTTIYGKLEQKPQETTEPAASGYLSTIFRADIDHELRRNILLFADFFYIDNDYQQSVPDAKENESTIGFGAGARYLFNRRFFMEAKYAYEQRDSDIASQEYTDNTVMVNLGAQL